MNWCTTAAFTTIGILWGSAWILAPILPLPPLLAGAARFAISAAILAVAAVVKRDRRMARAGNFPLGPSILLGITMVGLPYALAIWAKDSVSAGLVAVAYAAMPLATLLFSREFGAARIPAMAIGIGGVAFLVAQGIDYSTSQIIGLIFLTAAVILGAFSLNYAKSTIPRGWILLSSAIQCAVASVLLLFLSGIGGWPSPVSWTWRSFLALTVLAAAVGAIAFPLLFWLLTQVESWQVATLQWVATLCAIAEAAWFLRARPTLQMCVGAAMLAGAMFWLMRHGRGPEGDSDTVTLQITNRIQSGSSASDSR